MEKGNVTLAKKKKVKVFKHTIKRRELKILNNLSFWLGGFARLNCF